MEYHQIVSGCKKKWCIEFWYRSLHSLYSWSCVSLQHEYSGLIEFSCFFNGLMEIIFTFLFLLFFWFAFLLGFWLRHYLIFLKVRLYTIYVHCYMVLYRYKTLSVFLSTYNIIKMNNFRAISIFLERFEQYLRLSGKYDPRTVELVMLNLMEDDKLTWKLSTTWISFPIPAEEYLGPDSQSRTLKDAMSHMKQRADELVDDYTVRIESEAGKSFSLWRKPSGMMPLIFLIEWSSELALWL